MSLLRLLTSGKTLMGIQNPGGRYRMGAKGLLPKFGGRNPFSDQPAPPAGPSTGKIPRYQMSPSELAAARLKETKRLPMPPAATPQTSEPVAPKSKRWVEWVKWVASVPSTAASACAVVLGQMRRVSPLAWWRQRRKQQPAPKALQKSGKLPVQGELSLDNVKVVCNDLSDADVEIVPAASVPKAVSVKEPEPAATVEKEAAAELLKT